MHLNEPERVAYERHQDSLHHEASIVKSNYDAGNLNGIETGEKNAAIKIAIALKKIEIMFKSLNLISQSIQKETLTLRI